MPQDILIGQSWSAWVPARNQWLLVTVTAYSAGKATLRFDARYAIRVGENEKIADSTDMLSNRNLYRFIADQSVV
jgi:hypothetical protein